MFAFSSSLVAPSLYWYYKAPLINKRTCQCTAQRYTNLGICVYLQGCKELRPDPWLSSSTHGSDGHASVLLLPGAQAGRWAGEDLH